MVEERRRENWRALRTGAKVFVAGSWVGKMEMWRGLFCWCVSVGSLTVKGIRWTYIAADDA
jgi:hypothetical protein